MSLFRRRSVNVAGARALMAQGWQLIDVRSAREWDADHLDEARSVPLNRIEQSLDQLDPDAPILTLCHSGLRSAMAARTLRFRGREALTVRGGMIAWRRSQRKWDRES
jgi:rhodanese-related sulfurtransferase